MADIIYDSLERCVFKLQFNQSVGTGCLVAPSLAITCAHVIPSTFVAGNEFSFRWDERTVTAKILALLTDNDEDLCIFQLLNYTSENYVLFGDEVKKEDKISGYGFPIDAGEVRMSGFSGRYEALDQSSNKTRYPHGFFKIKNTVIKPGYSGAPAINLRTGKCIGIITETRDSRIDLGGWIIRNTLIVQELNKIPEYNSLDSSKMQQLWSNVAAEELQNVGAVYQSKPGWSKKRIDEIYICDRENFRGHFQLLYEQNKSRIHNYLVIGPAPHSPLGLSRKIVYERFTSQLSDNRYHYSSDPNESITNPLELKGMITFRLLVESIYNVLFGNEKVSAYDMKNNSLQDILKKLVRRLNDKPVNFLIVELVYRSTQEKTNFINFFKEFVDTLKQYESQLTSEILFFWCFSYEGSMSNQTLVLTKQLLRIFSCEPLPKWPFWEWWLPSRIKEKLQELIRNTTSTATLGFVNNCDTLSILPKKDIENWINRINREGKLSGYTVPGHYFEKLPKAKNTIAVEDGFLEIIQDYNKTTRI